MNRKIIMAYEIYLNPEAEKELSDLPVWLQRVVEVHLQRLAQSSLPMSLGFLRAPHLKRVEWSRSSTTVRSERRAITSRFFLDSVTMKSA